MAITTLNFITGNKNKLAEVQAILGKVIEVNNEEVDVPEIQGTIEEIAKEKARRAAEVVISSQNFHAKVPFAYEGIDQWTCIDRRHCA